jgi:predicted CopG family antitoxin
MSNRHTISIRQIVYTKLLEYGKFGESFSDLLSRILKSYETDNQNFQHEMGRRDALST